MPEPPNPTDINSTVHPGSVAPGGQVAGNVAIHKAAIPATTSLHQLPSPPTDFVGREAELGELDAQFEKGIAISGLRGLGGVGKTALALVLAQRLTPRFPDAQFFVEMKGTDPNPLSPSDALAHIIRSFAPSSKLPDNQSELEALYRSLLHVKRTLILLDNARDAAQVAPLLPPQGSILIVTSRQHFTLPGLYARDLDTLPPADAVKLLLEIAPRVGDQATGIAKLCGYLPLALCVAGRALAERKDVSPESYLKQLKNEKMRLDLVEAALTLSFNLLSRDQQARFAALAVFPGTWDVAAAAAVWEMEDDPAQDALGELLRYSLVEWDATTSRYRLHDLVRLFAASRLSESDGANATRRHAARYLDVLWETDKIYEDGGDSILRGLTLFDLEWGNIQAGQAWAAAHAAEDKQAAQLCSRYPTAGAHCLDLRQHPREQIRWLQSALAAARHLGDRDAEGNALGSLGNAYTNLGETHKAIDYYEQALVIDREIGDRRGQGAGLGNLGSAYLNLGETRKAIEYHEQALVILREIGDRRGEGAVLGNLGIGYKNLGETTKAIEFYEQRLVIAQEIGDRRGEGNALWNMALAYDSLGDRARAISLAQAALAIYEQIEDPNAAKVREQLDEWKQESSSKPE